MQYFSYKSHIIKTLFAIFDKFTIFFAFKIKQLKLYETGVKSQLTSNNFIGLQKSLKKIKIFEYLKNKLGSKGFLLLQETNSSLADEKK